MVGEFCLCEKMSFCTPMAFGGHICRTDSEVKVISNTHKNSCEPLAILRPIHVQCTCVVTCIIHVLWYCRDLRRWTVMLPNDANFPLFLEWASPTTSQLALCGPSYPHFTAGCKKCYSLHLINYIAVNDFVIIVQIDQYKSNKSHLVI